MLAFLALWMGSASASFGAAAQAAIQESTVTVPLRQKALAVLRETLEKESGWDKVRASENLLSLDHPEAVLTIFQAELKSRGDERDYRIGIWSVLAQAADTDVQREQWVNQIRAVFLDPAASDRLTALQTLARLGYRIRDQGDEEFARTAQGGSGALQANAQWVLANSGTAGGEAALVALLVSENPDTRLHATQALRRLPKLSPPAFEKLAAQARQEPSNSAARIYLVSAAFVQAAPSHRESLKQELLQYARGGNREEKVEAGAALAQAGGNDDLPLIDQLLEDNAPDVRMNAALAILRIGRRIAHHLGWLDWGVIGLYGLGMVAIGWYYSRQNLTVDNYLLGARQMKPTAIGLSLFATLLSSISYLSWPGEMIKEGPVLFFAFASYPFIVLVVGWLLIPSIMKLRVTSAYEILESRLGLSVRMVGASFFLSLRLLWMATIIYATTSKVLIPLTGMEPTLAPLIGAVIGAVTILYTSMGGLRAVVFTDVAQTLILFAGAIVTLAVVTANLGGVGAWWPHQWYANWAEPKFWFDPDKRTFAGAFLATFTWYICTCGSDQMAIQRYLATRDVQTARRAFTISMVTDMVVGLFLGAIGLALLAYFHAHPEMIPDGQTIRSNADQLFPQFIVFGLPAGLSGLVVAALLAAAMSSLSAGFNSSSSVITVDFLDRFRPRKKSEREQVKLTKIVSILVGAAVVGLSLYVSTVEGNLLEVCFKVVNLLVAPLFLLFFMAMYVPWATSFGTLLGAACSVAVAVGIAYYHFLGLTFLWIMPGSLVAGVAVGALASLWPMARKSKLCK